ncbi:TPA: hypothetical protein ACY3LZ_004124 [Citrobacter freundii]
MLLDVAFTPAAVPLGTLYLPALAHYFLCMHSGGHWRAGSAYCRTQNRQRSDYQ